VAEHEPLVDAVAAAILDGSTIDWKIVDTASSGADRGLIDELRLLAAVAELHRGQPDRPLLDAAPAGAWGHLRLLERVGGGTFGDVYRAHDTRLQREVAVKFVRARGSGDAALAAIIHEARLLARVRHPGIVTVYDAQQIGERVGLWMEYVRGRTLEQRLDEHGVCTPAEAIDVGIELCRAVAAVHDAGLIHRDIKTQNVMRAEDGRLVLMDFGVGREVADGPVHGLAGTPLYLAPEILGGRPATVRTDVYSIGVLLFHVLTGSFPVQAALASELRRAHDRGDRQRLLDARRDVPPNLAAVIDRAVDPDADRRFATAAELGAALEAVRPRVRSRRWLIAAAAGVLLFAGVAAATARGWITIGGDDGRALLDPQQWILIGAFTGTTGDAEFDAALHQAVTSELEASSYVNVFPTAWVRERLAAMSHPVDARLDDTLGLDLSRREGLAGFVTGSLDVRNGPYRIALRATHVPTGREIVTPVEERHSREEALQAALALGRGLRELLGESRTSIQMTSPPLAPVTSQSLDARRQFALGRALFDEERGRAALPHFVDAAARDPWFAMAHLYAALTHFSLGEHVQGRAAIEKAAALAQDPNVKLALIEREKILADYHSLAERFDEAAARLRAILTVRPGDGRIQANLGVIYGSQRQYGPAIEALEAAARRYPHWRVRWMLADMYSAAGRPSAATDLLRPYRDRPSDSIAYARHLAIAGRRDEASAALAEAARGSHASAYETWADVSLAKADFLRSDGRYESAEAVLRQGLDRASDVVVERLELALASLLLETARRNEAIGRLRRVDIGLSRNRIVHGVLAARAGDLDTASAILDHLEEEAAERRAPRPEARVHQLRAEIALARGDGPAAHEAARLARRAFETTWTLTTLARAQQAVGLTDEAIMTWTTILARPGERAIDWDAPAYSQFVLAHYELGRLLERAGRREEALEAYDQFLRFWDGADADLPRLHVARARRARLAGQGAQSTPAGRVPKPAA
jgi:serine/threonine-protein kinase